MIDRNIKEKDGVITEDDAEEIFVCEWNKIKKTITDTLKPMEDIKRSQFDDIRELYQANSLSSFNIDSDRTQFYKYFEDSKGDFTLVHLLSQ